MTTKTSLDFAKYLGAGKTVLAEKKRSLAKLCVSRGIYQQPKCFPLTPQAVLSRAECIHWPLCQQPAHPFTPNLCKRDSLFSLPRAFSSSLSHESVFAFVPYSVYWLTPSHVRKHDKITYPTSKITHAAVLHCKTDFPSLSLDPSLHSVKKLKGRREVGAVIR